MTRIFIVPGIRRVVMKKMRSEGLRFVKTELHDHIEGLTYLGKLFTLNNEDARFLEEALGVEVGVGTPTPGDYLFFWDRDAGPLYEVI